MTDRPILFSGPMVRALLDGSKTQTRRVMRYQPDECASVTVERFHQTVVDRHGEEQPGPEVFGAWWAFGEHGCACPYGQPGDRLWVRESFWGCDLPGYGDQPCVVYEDEWHGKEYRPAEPRPWARKFGHIPGIHMPRDSSRINLEITGVRVERLQDISDADSLAEGVDRTNTSIPGYAKKRYHQLWESINGPGSWDANPWVWVVEFRRQA